MSEHENRPEQLKAIEAALAALTPAASSVDRDRLMYLAGQASVEPSRPALSRWLWPLAMAASVLVAGTVGVVAGSRLEPRVVERVVHVPVKETSLAATVATNDREDRTPTYLRDLNRLLAGDTPPAAVGRSQGTAASPSSYIELRRQTLDLF